MSDLVSAALTIAAKDIRIEWRTRTAVISALVFAILVLSILYVARDATAVPALALAPSALWVTFSFAAMIGLNRAFLTENELGAMDAIRLSGVSPSALFLGKFGSNLAFVGAVEGFGIPIFVLFYDVPIGAHLPALLLVTVMTTVAFVSVGTLLSAMVVQTRFAEVMLPVLLLPFLIPPVVAAVHLTAVLLGGRPLSAGLGWLKLLAAFDVAFVTLSTLLFEATLSE